MSNRHVFPVALAASLALPGYATAQEVEAAPDCACKDILTPTQMMDAYWAALSDPGNEIPQAALGWHYLNLITMDGETIPERRLTSLALGEAAFLTFQPGVSRYYYSQAADGHDLIARHATDRIMQITFRAYDDKPAAKQMVDDFYDLFPPTILNHRGRFQQVRNFADWHLAEGRTDEAMALVLDELQRLPTDAPYASFSLPITYAEQIAQSEHGPAITSLAQEKLEGLKRLQASWAESTHAAEDDPTLTSPMPQWYWTAQGIRPGETFMQGRARQLHRMIDGLEHILKPQEAS